MTDTVTLTLNPAIDVSTSVDRVLPVRKLRCAAPMRDPGGGGVNVARVIRRFGGKVTAVHPAGGDTGRLLHRLVEAEGVRSVAVPVNEETRISFTVLETESGAQYRFVMPGPTLAEAEWSACLDAIARFEGRARFLVASGSFPPGAPQDFYARLVRVAKSLSARIVFDTSGPALQAALGEGVHLVKPNLRELQELTGRRLDDEPAWLDACRSLTRAKRAEIVVLTLAEKGALLVTEDRAMRAPGVPVTVVSAVGAGDSFLGAMVWALAAGKDLEEAFRYGVAAGSAALLTPGTELCRPEDVVRLLPDVVVRHV